MTIHVQYKNDKYDYVNSQMLDDLIERREIKQFYRSFEKAWVSVEVGPIRQASHGSVYPGPERRRATPTA